MEPLIKPKSTREDYDACLAYAQRHHYWAMYTAMAEDGFDPSVDYKGLMND